MDWSDSVKPEISVIMSVYNDEKYIAKAIDSILTQSFSNFELIICDDYSTDRSSNIIEKYVKQDNRIVFFKNEKNLGLATSLNRCIERAKGKYIARMDSDDVSRPDRFAVQSEFLDTHKDVAVIGAYIQEFSDICENLGVRKFPLDTDGAKKLIYKANPLAHPAVMMRKSMFDDGISYDENYRTSQDLALWFDILTAGYNVANIDKVLLNFRRNDSVYKRRSNRKDSNLEFKVHEKGIYKLFGISPYKSLFPIARYILRLLPSSIIRMLYNGKIRRKLTM